MATLSITVTAAQATRIQTAFGHMQFDPNTMTPGSGTWVPATAAEVTAELKKYLRERVRSYEAQQAMITATNAVNAETDW